MEIHIKEMGYYNPCIVKFICEPSDERFSFPHNVRCVTLEFVKEQSIEQISSHIISFFNKHSRFDEKMLVLAGSEKLLNSMRRRTLPSAKSVSELFYENGIDIRGFVE